MELDRVPSNMETTFSNLLRFLPPLPAGGELLLSTNYKGN